MNATCPEMPDLLDHMEGRLDLGEHLAGCEPCSLALSELRAALSAESVLVATAPLGTERALSAVMARARTKRSRGWQASIFFSAAAAAALMLLMPGKLVPTAGRGDEGGGNGTGISTRWPANVQAPENVHLDEKAAERILGPSPLTTFTSTAVVSS